MIRFAPLATPQYHISSQEFLCNLLPDLSRNSSYRSLGHQNTHLGKSEEDLAHLAPYTIYSDPRDMCIAHRH